jgi:hypothetical protein
LGTTAPVCVVLFGSAGIAMAQDRMPPIPGDKMTESQKQAAVRFKASRGQEVFGPFVPLLRAA